jgi:hypothetical protein
MNKIKHISQLYSEQLRLQKHEEDLEKNIRKDWKEVKESMHPKNLGKEILSACINKKLQDKIKPDGIFSGSVSYEAAMLTKKLFEKAEEKINAFFGK